MSASGLAYDRYTARGFDEWMMRIGDAGAPALLFLPPLFEEMNRTRALLAGTMRLLAARGWSCWLPDLPGTGESERPLERCGWDDWREAVAAAARAAGGAPAAAIALRGGALLDEAAGAACRWRLAPVGGAALARDLGRAGLVGDGGTAGYAPDPALVAALAAAAPSPAGPLRVVRLASDPGEADRRIDSPPVWRRAEPQRAPELAALIAEDIDQWVRACAPC